MNLKTALMEKALIQGQRDKDREELVAARAELEALRGLVREYFDALSKYYDPRRRANIDPKEKMLWGRLKDAEAALREAVKPSLQDGSTR